MSSKPRSMSQGEVDALIARIADRDGPRDARAQAIREAVEVFAPKTFGDRLRSEKAQRLIDATTSVVCDHSGVGLLPAEAVDALGLVWVWRGEFDAETYWRMTTAARSAAREVVGEEYSDWLPPDPDIS